MIKPEQIPNEAVVALKTALSHLASAREAIADAINSWPGAYQNTDFAMVKIRKGEIILTVPQEKNDD